MNKEDIEIMLARTLNEIERMQPGTDEYGKAVKQLNDQLQIRQSLRKEERDEEALQSKEGESVIWRILENGALMSALAGLSGVIVLVVAESAGSIITSVAKSFIRFK